MEVLGDGPPVSYEACVRASIGMAPERSDPEEKRERAAELLSRAGFRSANREELLAAVDAWRESPCRPHGVD